MTVAISGLSGFVGKNLAPFLNEFRLLNLDRKALSQITNSWLNNQSVDTIIHLAGKAHDLKKVSDPQEYYTVNFELTKKLYDAFLASTATKFIFLSSVKAAADSVDGILDESANPKPETDYGKSKLLAEQYIQNQPLPPDKSFFILRPCMIHGPGNKGNLNLLYRFVKKGIPYPLAGFGNNRSFLSVANLCFVVKEIIKRENIDSGIYQVADDEPLSTNEVIVILSKSIGKKPKLWKIPSALIKLIAKVGDVLKLPISTERLQKLTESYIVSNNKIKLAIGKDFPLSSREGLALTAKSFSNTI